MRLTKAMKERAECLGATWVDEGDGYASISGFATMGIVAYVAIPAKHPMKGRHYDAVGDGEDYPEVNGGLTFSEGNVFGWDYMHLYNSGSPDTDIPAALEWFRSHAEPTP